MDCNRWRHFQQYLVVIGTDRIGNCKSNYNTITTAPYGLRVNLNVAIVSLQKSMCCVQIHLSKKLLILNLYVDGVCSISGTGFWFAQNEQSNQFQFETGLY